MPKMRIDDTLETYYEDHDFTDPWRTAEAIVMHHGNGKNLKLWYAWVPLLAGQYRVVRLDGRGFGQSTVPPEGYRWTLDKFAEDLKVFLDSLGLDKVHLIGETLGGAVCLQFTSLYPERVKSVAVCTSPIRRDGEEARKLRDMIDSEGMEAWAKSRVFSHLNPNQSDPGHREWYAQQMANTTKRVMLENVIDLIGDWSDQFAKIRVPTLIMASEAVDKENLNGKEMQRVIPNSRLVVVPGTSGYIQHAFPEQCVATWKEFAATLD